MTCSAINWIRLKLYDNLNQIRYLNWKIVLLEFCINYPKHSV
jgi:hypothetical protein